MTKLKNVPLDGCERNIINEDGSDTIGNVLCDRISRFLPGINEIKDAKVVTEFLLNIFTSKNQTWMFILQNPGIPVKEH